MTEHDIAQLRGEVFGMQLVLPICLAKICEAMQRTNDRLAEI